MVRDLINFVLETHMLANINMEKQKVTANMFGVMEIFTLDNSLME